MPERNPISKADWIAVVIEEEYPDPKDPKKKKRKSLEVGRAWVKVASNGDEFISIKLMAGLSVSGQLACFPRKKVQQKEDPELPSGGPLPR